MILQSQKAENSQCAILHHSFCLPALCCSMLLLCAILLLLAVIPSSIPPLALSTNTSHLVLSSLVGSYNSCGSKCTDELSKKTQLSPQLGHLPVPLSWPPRRPGTLHYCSTPKVEATLSLTWRHREATVLFSGENSMAAELESYKLAHTSLLPLTGDSRLEESPAPNKE